MIGTASLHRLRYRCTLTFENADRFQWPIEAKLDRNRESTIYIDVDHFHRNDEVAAVRKSTAIPTGSPAVVKLLRERVDLLSQELPKGKVKPNDVLRALDELSQVAQFGPVEWRLHDLMQFAEQSRGPGVISPAEYMEIVAAHQKSRGSTPFVTSGELQDKAEKDSVVVIDLYGGSQVLPGLGKNPGYSKLVQSLNAMKRVAVNIREAGQGDVIMMAIVRDPSQRCQREARQTQKESELRIAINSALKAAGIEATRWDENAESKSADKAETQSGLSKTDPLPSPEQLREQLEPVAKRVTAAEARVRELEAVYFRDRSNAGDLQRAFEEMTEARRDWRERWKSVEPLIPVLGADTTSAGVIADALENRLAPLMKQVSEGKATEAELKVVNDSIKRAYETRASAKGKYDHYMAALRKVEPDDADESTPYSGPPTAPQPGYHPDVALAWLEAATDLKLEFIQFDDLKLPFKAALRIRESSNGLGLTSGDLIVALYEQRFDSLDQAVIALMPSTRSHDPGVQHRLNAVLRGGLAGRPVKMAISYKSWPIDYLKPGFGHEAVVRLEVRVRDEATNKIETQYVTGTCVSPDGLVIIPVPSKSLVDGEPIVAFDSITGTARVVSADEKHGLTLLKVSSPKQPLFSWVQCRSGKPTTSQRLKLYNDKSTNAVDSAAPVVVAEIGQSYLKPLDGDDAFVVLTGPIVQASDGVIGIHLRDRSALVPKPGDRLMSVEDELQGMILTSLAEGVSKDAERQRLVAIPAVHIQKLIDEYRRSTAKQKPEAQALSQSPKVDAPLNAERAVEQLIALLQNDRQGDRDPVQFIAALQQIRTMDLGEKAQRVATAILAAMEFHDPISKGPPNAGKPPPGSPSVYAMDALIPITRSAKTPAFVAALRDGHRHAKVVAVWSLNNDPSLWEYAQEPDFPALAEQILAVAAGPDELPRVASLGLLAKTLPLTKIDLAEITTNDRREALRKFGAGFPRERVRQLIVEALSDTHIDVVLTAGPLVLEMLAELPDLEVKARLVDAPTQIVAGKFHDVTASASQRGQALSLLAKRRDRSAPAVPILIKLLKSSDLEFPVVPGTNPRSKRDSFTREKVILTLGAIGPAAKDALPILEAELAALDKKEKEDALLSGATGPRPQASIGSTSASVLRAAIGLIKGESRDSLLQ